MNNNNPPHSLSLPDDILRRIPMFAQISARDAEEFRVLVNRRGDGTIAFRCGYPIDPQECDMLIAKLQEYRNTLPDFEEYQAQESQPIRDSIWHAVSRTRDFHPENKVYGQPGFVYVVQSIKLGYIKIGKSVRPDMRFKELRKEYGFDFTIENVIPCSDMNWAELYLHRHMEEYRIGGEWFFASYEMLDWLERITSLTPSNIGIGEHFSCLLYTSDAADE